MAKLPYMQFYVNDWLADDAVRASSPEARALWIDLLCFMQNSPRRGYLLAQNGKPYGVEQIARMCGFTAQRAKAMLDELHDNGVYSVTDDGVIYCRRMVRDEHISSVRRAAVSKRFDRTNQPTNAPTDGHTNDLTNGLQRSGLLQKPEFRSEKPEAKSQNSEASGGLDGYPQFAAAAREYFPAVDDSLLEELIGLAIAEHPPITDVDLETVVRAATKPHQKQATLWRKTIPEVIRSWK